MKQSLKLKCFLGFSFVIFLLLINFENFIFSQNEENIDKIEKINSLDTVQWYQLDVLLKETANDRGEVILLTVNRSFADMLMNWICFLKDHSEIKNYIFYSVNLIFLEHVHFAINLMPSTSTHTTSIDGSGADR